MLKKTITYEDFNGETTSEDFFFHLSKAELVELELSEKDGLSETLQSIINAEDGKRIVAEFKKIILGAYGKRSEDGRFFKKNQQIRDEFESSEAYSVLFMELVTNPEAAGEFVNGIIPTNLSEEAAKITEKPALAAVPEPEIVSPEDVKNMTPEEIQSLGARIMSGEVKLGEPRKENIEHNETPAT